MSIRPMPEPARPMRAPIGRSRTRPAGLIGLAVLAMSCGPALSKPAEAAAKLCGDRQEILQRLAQAHEEKPRALGLSGDGGRKHGRE